MSIKNFIHDYVWWSYFIATGPGVQYSTIQIYNKINKLNLLFNDKMNPVNAFQHLRLKILSMIFKPDLKYESV